MKRLSLYALAVAAGLMFAWLSGCSSDNNNGYGSNPTSPPPASNTVSMSGSRFVPSTLTVTAGTTVTWKNNDGYAHTATSDSSTWNTGNVAAGASAQVTFSTPGTYGYYCTYHRAMGMTGTIVVH